MAATATVTIQGSIIGNPTGGRTIGPLTLSSAAANGTVQQVVILSAGNTITVPSSPAPSGVVIKLPDTNTSVTTLKGVTGDTGIKIGKTGTTVMSFDTANLPASFFLVSASDQPGLYTEITFI